MVPSALTSPTFSLQPAAMLASPSEDDSLLSLVLEAQRLNAESLKPKALAKIVSGLLAELCEMGYPTMIGVSAAGERLIGAVMLASKGAACAMGRGEKPAGRSVVLVDGVIVTPAVLESTTEALRTAGAQVMGAIVVDQLSLRELPSPWLYSLAAPAPRLRTVHRCAQP